MKKLFVLSILLLSVVCFAADVDFSGTWKINNDKTEMPDFGQGRRGRGMNFGMTVTQDGDKLKIERKRPGWDGEEHTETVEVVIGGEQVVTKNERGETYTIAAWEGDKLKIEEKRYFETPNGDMELYTKALWSLIEEGKELLVESTMTTPRGDREMKMYYIKE